MRLINVNTLKLEDFFDRNVPAYAILSHRWGSEELTFKEVDKNRADLSKGGYIKMKAACEVAAKAHHLQYLWIDTCCIDKRSSAELTEVINSMYRWYQNAKVCIVYLQDVDRLTPDVASKTNYAAFENSEWFSRAWTLQELLAPEEAHFYDHDWTLIGTKTSLETYISDSTQIPVSALRKEKDWAEYPIAQRMSWASRRNATREEDLAYSLLGIFGVNMPMLYGEGRKAFIRLQEEIIRLSPDRSFLLWGVGSQETEILASSPAQFDDVPDDIEIDKFRSKTSFALTNVGLKIELELKHNRQFECYEFEIIRKPDGRQWGGDGYYSYYMLILKLDPDSGHMEKKGVVRKKLQAVQIDSEWGETLSRGFTIATMSLNSLKIPGKAERSPYAGLDTNSDFLPLLPVAYRHRNHWYKWKPSENSAARQLCGPFPSCSDDAIRMSYVRKDNFQLWFDFFFDFDFYPCVYITNECISDTGRYFFYMNESEIVGPYHLPRLEWNSVGSCRYAVVPADPRVIKGMICRSYDRYSLHVTLLPFLSKQTMTKLRILGPLDEFQFSVQTRFNKDGGLYWMATLSDGKRL